MAIVCARCQTQIPLAPDRIPAGLFLVTCPACYTGLAVEITVRPILPYSTEGGSALPGAAPTAEDPPETPKPLGDPGADRLREMALKVLQGDRDEIPVLSRVALKIRSAMQDPRQHAAEIVRIVRSDQALSTRLIRLGNSAYYHGAQPVADISSALRRVGFQAVETLVVAASTRDVFRPRTAAEAGIMASLWDHAVAVAVAAKWIARETGKVDPERAFLGGLVHDIGRALVLRVFDEALARAQGGRKDVPVERIIALIGVHHAELGGVLLEKWAFPPDEVLAARGHHAPLELPGEEPLPAVVGLADLVARKAGMDAGAEEPDGQVWHRLAAHLGMSDAKLASLLVELEDLQTEIKQLLPA